MEISGLHVLNLIEGILHIGDATGAFATLVLGKKNAFLADTTSGLFDLANVVRSLTDLPLIVANTHGHIHHVGGNYQFAKVYLNPLDRARAQSGCDKGIRNRMLEAYPNVTLPEDRLNAFLGYRLENVEELLPGVCFELGGEDVEAIPLPNHTEGSMGFLCKKRRLLIAGDSLAPWMCLYGPGASSLTEHIALLKKMEEDPRFDRFLSAHSSCLWEKSTLHVFRSCAENAAAGRTTHYVDPTFPEITGEQFIQGSSHSGERAAIIFDPNNI